MQAERISVTEEARAVIDQLRQQHGELMFHQSGGCCDGSSPMCFADGEFLIGSRDVCLGEIHGCNFYMSADQFEYYRNMHISVDVAPGSMSADQFEYYRNMHISVDVAPGRGSSFSLEIPLGLRFMAVSRLLTEDELQNVRPVD
jgi:uncharacterized protein (DUF779 family)